MHRLRVPPSSLVAANVNRAKHMCSGAMSYGDATDAGATMRPLLSQTAMGTTMRRTFGYSSRPRTYNLRRDPAAAKPSRKQASALRERRQSRQPGIQVKERCSTWTTSLARLKKTLQRGVLLRVPLGEPSPPRKLEPHRHAVLCRRDPIRGV